MDLSYVTATDYQQDNANFPARIMHVQTFRARKIAQNTVTSSHSASPLVSFVIAIKNAAHDVEGCINNFRQFQIPIQLIVKDGLSSDNSAKIVERCLDRVDCFIQKPDTGIYSAWNQALPSATGTYVAFCGADDRPNPAWFLQHADTLRAQANNIDLVYGDLVKSLHGKFRKYPSPVRTRITANDLERFWLPHPALLHRAELFHKNLFQEELKLAGDYHFILREALRRGHLNVMKLDGVQCVMRADGVSHSLKAVKIYEEEFVRMRDELKVNICPASQTAKVLWRLNIISPPLANMVRKMVWLMKGKSTWQ